MSSTYKVIGGKLDGTIRNSFGDVSIDSYELDYAYYCNSYPLVKQVYKVDKVNKTITYLYDL